ncbi:putative membrane protein [Variovorax sp. PBL-H6]|nr:putative membrane protein [Variovorax sp. PBL-H6]
MMGWQRLLFGAAVGVAVGLLPWHFGGVARGLLGWCCGAAAYLLPAWWLAETSDAQSTRTRAQSLDQPNVLILAAMVAGAGVSMVTIALLLKQVGQMGEATRIGHIVLGLLALTGSWLMIHTIYGFHYAHRYYQAEPGREPGLDFPGELDPDYFDFLYYAFVIGMTSQVSDVQVRSREMRRITLVHSVLSFAFNMLVLALSINVVAGAI